MDSLSEIGLTLQDHDDSPFNSGSSLSVLAFQPSPDLSIEKVIETLKPSIYFQGRLIQMGEVIVGTPELRPATEDPKDGDLK